MKKPPALALAALGLTLGLAGFGPPAMATRNHDDSSAANRRSCSTEQDNSSENSTGGSSQSGLININNVGLQGNNLDVLGNLLCQGVFLNDIVAAVLGTATGAENDGDGDGARRSGCSTDQDADSENSTGDSEQSGLVNLNNVALQGNNLDVLGNALCSGNFLNGLTAAVLGTATAAEDSDDDGRRRVECTSEQDADSDNDTGESGMGGLVNLNNVALQGNNIGVLGNGLCGSDFLNGLVVSILGRI